MLILKNPHSILAAMQTRPKSVASIRLTTAKPAGAWEQVADAARSSGIPVQIGSDRPHGGRRTAQKDAGKEGRMSGSEAEVHPVGAVPVSQLFGQVDGNKFDLWLALDQVQDPHNVGAIFRSAAFFGVKGIILTRDRSAPITAVVYDTATGGMEYVPHAQPSNLRSALEEAKQRGLWILGTDEHQSREVYDIPRERPWLLVLGNEGGGIRKLTGQTCDEICRLSPRGSVGSLNVSVAAGALLSALLRPFQ